MPEPTPTPPRPESATSLLSTSSSKVKVKQPIERKRSVASELKLFRKESAERQAARDKAIEKREERKIKAIKDRNDLLKRTNELLEKLVQAEENRNKE